MSKRITVTLTHEEWNVIAYAVGAFCIDPLSSPADRERM